MVDTVVGDDAIAEYVRAHGGKRAIRKVLVAWCYLELGDERAIEFVVMATPDDLNANAEFIRLADQYIEVPGGSNANNYANVKLITDVAMTTGVDAVWPGWGHASENPKLPTALRAAGITFMGPPPSVMSVLGDKIAANILAQTAKVPSIPWSGSWGNPGDDGPLQAQLQEDGTIPKATFDQACVKTLEEALAAADRVGYPVMLKASEGGGGKGIRMNQNREDMLASYPQVVSEVPGSPVFVMQLVSGARHLEVQVVGDEHGNAIALNGRDCSTQRRFQKIFEEGPPTKPTGGIADPAVFTDMEEKARNLVKSIGYQGAGTVEYLYDSKTDTYSFLELNPRLQVEHPVTEGITGVNMPAAQLQVAMGIPLNMMPQVRSLYNVEPTDLTTVVDLDTRYVLPGNRHVVAARITAENPDEGFKPTSGKIERVSFQSTPSVWGYFSVGANGGIHEFADSQFGHLFASGTNREEARKALVLALKELTVRGEIRNPVEYLAQLLETDAFKANDIDTQWLDGILKEKAIKPTLNDNVVVASAALFRAYQITKAAKEQFQTNLLQGQFSTAIFDDLDTFEIDVVLKDVRYILDATRTGDFSYSMKLRGDETGRTFACSARPTPDGTLLANIDGVSRKLNGFEEPLGLRMNIDGATIFIPAAFDPSEIRSDVTGKLVRWLVPEGGAVDKGAPFAEVEAMKMIMPLRAAETGTIVSHASTAGSVISTGDLLATLELKDASKARTILPYSGATFEPKGVVKNSLEAEAGTGAQRAGRAAVNAAVAGLTTGLDGYVMESDAAKLVTTALLKPGFEMEGMLKLEARDVAGAIGQKMPADLDAALVAMSSDNSAEELAGLLEPYADEPAVEPLRVLATRWAHGSAGVAADTVAGLLESYLAVEEKFVGFKNKDDAVRAMLKVGMARSAVNAACPVLFAHSKIKRRSEVVTELLKALPKFGDHLDAASAPSERLLKALERLAALEIAGPAYASVALTAGMTRLEATVPTAKVQVASMRAELKKAMADDALTAFAFAPSLGSYQRGVDVLTFLFDDADPAVAEAAAEVYVRRMYSAHDMLQLDVGRTAAGTIEASFWYKFRSADPAAAPLRFGKLVVCACDSGAAIADSLEAQLASAVIPAYLADMASAEEAVRAAHGGAPAEGDARLNTLHVMMTSPTLLDDLTEDEEENLIARLEAVLAAPATDALVNEAKMRSVNVIATSPPMRPRYYTLVAPSCIVGVEGATTFMEDPLRRGMRPTFYHLLELQRPAESFKMTPLPTVNRDLRVYVGDERNAKNPRTAAQSVLVRRLTHSTDLAESGAERLLDKALSAVEGAILDARVKSTASSRLFVNVIPPVKRSDGSPMTPVEVDAAFKRIMGGLISKNAARLLASNVDEIEVKFALAAGDGHKVTSMRCVATSASGPWLALRSYIEAINPVTGVAIGYCDLDGTNCLVDPYPSSDTVGRKRAAARRIGTTYAYDFPGLLEKAALEEWRKREADVAKHGGAPVEVPALDDILVAKELLVDNGADAEFGISTKGSREVGTNQVGMVGWELTMKTPEYPAGRSVVMIANDVTYQSGSFGVAEDDFFARVSTMAAARGIPRLYVSSNSGARIGLVEPLKKLVTPKWVDNDPFKGLDYLGLTPETLKTLPEGSVVAKAVNADGLHELEAIIGSDDQVPDGIGVENLRGSGTIAGLTSAAYDETFTLSYATGRSVGIGAYLMRLGQRVIQMRTGPMILTGFEALNKLLGKKVYTSQDQLGGPQVMSPNGITHLIVEDDYDGAKAMLNWLSYVPENAKKARVLSNALAPADPVDRAVLAAPPADGSVYDVRAILDSADGGLFDTGSFTETLPDWGKTVIAGRAKLGGIPFGVIAVETRTVEVVQPADPANPLSREAILPQAGQVWFPDSAFKTATAIRDFNRGENLPLMILANWRGFSGGTRDMYDAVLKFGAQIVDALREYDHPVFVYIPPKGELRGGAWVVVDPTINADMMEMYADPESRGGILEPPGIVEVKFRVPEQVAAMHRVDDELQQLDAKLAADPNDEATKSAISQREAKLAPLYGQLAIEFADLHDRTGRMVAKGVIEAAVPWASARTYFYQRAKRRLMETSLAKDLAKAAGSDFKTAMASLAAQIPVNQNDDAAVVDWLEKNHLDVDAFKAKVETAGVVNRLKELLKGRADADALIADALK